MGVTVGEMSSGSGAFGDLRGSRFPWLRLKAEHLALRLEGVPAGFARRLDRAARVAGAAASPSAAAFMFEDFERSSDRFRSPSDVELPSGGELSDASGFKLAFVRPGPVPARAPLTIADLSAPVSAPPLPEPGLRRAHFAGLFHGVYGTRSQAVCDVNSRHRAPVDGCQCGFHAFYEARRARAHWPSHPDAALVSVELYGDVVAHELGWRAAVQVVTGVWFRPACAVCRRRAVGVAELPPTSRRDVIEALGPMRVVPVCAGCSSSVVPLAGLATALGTEVAWAW